MKKTKYNRPEMTVCQIGAQSMMALSKMEGAANKEYEVLVNEDSFTDIWGNNW